MKGAKPRPARRWHVKRARARVGVAARDVRRANPEKSYRVTECTQKPGASRDARELKEVES